MWGVGLCVSALVYGRAMRRSALASLVVGVVVCVALAGCRGPARLGEPPARETLARRATMLRGVVEAQWQEARAAVQAGRAIDAGYVLRLSDVREGVIGLEGRLTARRVSDADRRDVAARLDEFEAVLPTLTPAAPVRREPEVERIPGRARPMR